MNKKSKVIVITIILILGILLINKLKYRNDELYAVNLKNKIDKDLVSILVSDGSDNYTNYEGSTFPSNTEYTYNSELSKCQDNNGNVIEGILSYDETTGKVRIRTKKTTYCYLYFDKKSTSFAEELIASGELWQSGLEGDGYRFVGSREYECSYDSGAYKEYVGVNVDCPTVYKESDGTYTLSSSITSTTLTSESRVKTDLATNNFVCFGTNSLSECKANEGKYLYRIIGVFPDESGEQHLKLIKYKQLGAYNWHTDGQVDITWEESDLYKGLNGISGGSYSNLFIGNTTYDHLQNETWLNKIVNWKWTATNTLTYSNSGPKYYNSLTPSEIYLHEMNRDTKTSDIGEWTYPLAKIGLMYASDFTLSLGSSALSIIGGTYTNKATLITGWLHQSNNDTTASSYEWTLSRSGADGRIFNALSVDAGGFVNGTRVLNTTGARPVFYLDSTVTTIDGNGEYDTPYIIAE